MGKLLGSGGQLFSLPEETRDDVDPGQFTAAVHVTPTWSLTVLQLKLCRHFRLQRDGEIPTRRASALELLLPAVQLGSFPLQLLLLLQQVGLGHGGGRLKTHKHMSEVHVALRHNLGSLTRCAMKTPLSVGFKWKHLTSCLSFMDVCEYPLVQMEQHILFTMVTVFLMPVAASLSQREHNHEK